MMLRGKLLLAQLPLALALVGVGYFSVRTTAWLGTTSQAILKDNYRSVLAAERMKDALDQLDHGAVFEVLGERARGAALLAESQPRFEAELAVQASNITERNEGGATAALERAWTECRARIGRFEALGDPGAARAFYFTQLEPQVATVRRGADRILALNQDAMVRKSDLARKAVDQLDTWLVLATLAALLAGGVASFALTTRLLRPLSVLTQAARRIGEGDLQARARVPGPDEVAQLAREFNEMADHLRKYRQTTLGELLQVQGAAQAAIDSLPDAVVAFDATGSVLSVNQAAERELHVDLEQGSALAAVDPEVRATFDRLRAHVMAGKGAYQPRGYEEALRVSGAAGDRFLLPRASPVYAEGGAVGGVTVLLQDVTRLRRFDELKNDLVATVAHEFRTPLTSLRMAIHLCLEGAAGPLTEKEAELLYAAREDCERLQGIVDDLLDLSRLQEGHEELRRRAISVQSLLERAAARVRSMAEAPVLEIEDLTAGGAVNVDVDRIDLVFANLITNAIRHSPPTSTVIVRGASSARGVRFEVVDRGPGVPEALRARVFEKLFRIPGGSDVGAGLGLYICKEIVNAHGGEIGVQETEGGGSTFWFTLPDPAQSPAS